MNQLIDVNIEHVELNTRSECCQCLNFIVNSPEYFADIVLSFESIRTLLTV